MAEAGCMAARHVTKPQGCLGPGMPAAKCLPPGPCAFDGNCTCTTWYPVRECLTERLFPLCRFGGPGHTSVLYTNPLNKEHIAHFGSVVKTVRVLINTPAAQVGPESCNRV